MDGIIKLLTLLCQEAHNWLSLFVTLKLIGGCKCLADPSIVNLSSALNLRQWTAINDNFLNPLFQ